MEPTKRKPSFDSALLSASDCSVRAGTSDLDRGLIGTLLNGYDTRFLKKTLRSKPLRPDEAAAAPVGAN